MIGKGDRERDGHRDRAGAPGGRGVPRRARRPVPRPLFISFHPRARGARENRLTADAARHVCRELALRLGIPPFRPHQLRHIRSGRGCSEVMGDARLTAETLGHRGLASVSGYTQITDARRREAYEEMQRRGL